MKETIFYLEGRGGMYLYHFFILNLGGLFYIINNHFNVRDPANTSVLLEDKSKIVATPSFEIKFPIKIHIKNVIPFQREAFEIIKDKFELVEDLSTISDYEIVSIYGEPCEKDGLSDHPKLIFNFLRELFLEKMDFQMIKGKRIFITRKNSESQHNGVLKRCVLNETDFINVLNKYNFEHIQLENFNTFEKIKLFMESEIVLSTHGSQLTLSLFLSEGAKIIEMLNKGTDGFAHGHYKNICNTLNLNYYRYSNILEDANGNFNVNINNFEEYLISLL